MAQHALAAVSFSQRSSIFAPSSGKAYRWHGGFLPWPRRRLGKRVAEKWGKQWRKPWRRHDKSWPTWVQMVKMVGLSSSGGDFIRSKCGFLSKDGDKPQCWFKCEDKKSCGWSWHIILVGWSAGVICRCDMQLGWLFIIWSYVTKTSLLLIIHITNPRYGWNGGVEQWIPSFAVSNLPCIARWTPRPVTNHTNQSLGAISTPMKTCWTPKMATDSSIRKVLVVDDLPLLLFCSFIPHFLLDRAPRLTTSISVCWFYSSCSCYTPYTDLV